MFKINKTTILLLLMIISCLTGFSQKKEMELAHAEFIDLQYNAAVDYYQKAIAKIKEDTPERKYSTFMLGECYRMMNDPDGAYPYYKELVAGNFGENYPVIYLRYANVLRTKGDISGAKEYYKKYLKDDPNNQAAKTGLKSCDWILANQNKRAQVNVYAVKSINSNDDDFGPAYMNGNYDQMVFTSNRFSATGKNNDQWTGSKFSDLYKSTLSDKEWKDPEPFDFLGVINTDIHEGTPSLNGDFNTIYFARCDRIGEKRAFCQLLKSSKFENSWMQPVVVFADSTANIGQPSLSSDELTLVFSSDMKGGKGGKDIWVARKESKEKNFGVPELLGPGINTAGDELFPYLFNDTTLFFASGGYEGYGGLDIYKSIWRKNTWSAPENLLAPINSGYDDFGIIIKTLDEEGIFTSNRPGGKGGDDIYQFTRRTLLFTVSGHIKDKATLLAMEGAQVFLIGEDRDTALTFTDKQGFYHFDTTRVLEDHAYDMAFKKDNYFSDKASVSTRPYEDDHNFTVDMMLEPIPEKPIVLPDILYELDKWDLLPQYQDSLMNLVEILHDNENLVIELRSHTDSRASYEYNDILSQKRAQSCVDFLVTQGVDPRRLVARGYGERIFRVLDKDLTRENYLFKAGTELNDQFINSLPTNEIKEAAFQLNRRTEFSVLAKDYKP
jgi:peptidoglycan-associated lipoprotein